MERYEPLDHTADTGLVAHGGTLTELFENAAFGLFDLMFDIEGLETELEEEVALEAPGLEDLMVAWLEELLFLSETRERAWSRFRVEEMQDERLLRGRVGGIPFDRMELRGPPVKAVTYHDLEVTRTAEGWRARLIFDV